MIAHSDLSADHAIVFDDGRAGNAGLRGNDDALADLDVVRDLNEIVNFRAFADASFAECAAINAGVRADFHIVFDYHRSDLRKFYIAVRAVAHIAETVRAYHKRRNAESLYRRLNNCLR